MAFVKKPLNEDAPALSTDDTDDDGIDYIGYEPNTVSVLPGRLRHRLFVP